MNKRDNRAEAVESDRTIVELSIVAAILFVIVFACANAQLIKNNINCDTPYIGRFC